MTVGSLIALIGNGRKWNRNNNLKGAKEECIFSISSRISVLFLSQEPVFLLQQMGRECSLQQCPVTAQPPSLPDTAVSK